MEAKTMRKRGFVAALLAVLFVIVSPNAFGSPDSGQKKKLILWHIQTEDAPKQCIDESIARFEKDYPEYTVEVVPMQNDAYKTKLKVAMGSTEMPDIFVHWSGGPMVSYIDAGKVADITAYMNKNNYKSRFMAAGISQATYKNKIWAMPVEGLAIAMVFYNKAVFAQYGLKVPKTLTELDAVAATLKSKGVTPFALANKTKWTGSMYYMYLVDRYGGPDVFANAANRKNGGTFEDPAFTKAGNKIVDWVKKGYYNIGFNGLDEDSGQGRALLYSGKAAMLVMGSWLIYQVKSENPDFMENLGAFPFPAAPDGKGDASDTVGTVGDNFYSISSSCKYPDAAFAALTYLLDDTAVRERIALGKIPPLNSVTVTEPLLNQVLEVAKAAKSNQLWYDQYLSPEMGELHKDTSQELFGLTKTPAEVNSAMEAKAKAIAAGQ
jgi:raffinose/stachyose/melibiose transport system substrate-binding protein